MLEKKSGGWEASKPLSAPAASSPVTNSAGEILAVKDSEVICGCVDLSVGRLQRILSSDGLLSFDELLSQTGAGSKCTACLLDLEYYFVELARLDSNGATRSEVVTREPKLSVKQRLFRLIDRLSPLVPVSLTERMPVLIGHGIEQWLWVANHSLLYEGKACAPEIAVDFTLRSENGHVVSRHQRRVPPGEALRVELTGLFPGGPAAWLPARRGAIGLASVEITRRARVPGIRGTIRPQMEIVAPAGACAVHTQAPGGQAEQWFTCLYRPAEERIFLSIVNPWPKKLDVEIDYPFVGPGCKPLPTLSTHVQVPPNGARLHEILLPEDYVSELQGSPIGIRWRAVGPRKVHVFCATPNLDRFSFDHV